LVFPEIENLSNSKRRFLQASETIESKPCAQTQKEERKYSPSTTLTMFGMSARGRTKIFY